ncbi:hypothetical protein ABTX61_09200 [Amycolatopsis japonica]
MIQHDSMHTSDVDETPAVVELGDADLERIAAGWGPGPQKY